MCSKVSSASLRTACMATLANMPSRTCTSSVMAMRVSAVEQGRQRPARRPARAASGRRGTLPPAAATSASVAHLKVKGMATVTSLATSISSSETTTVRLQVGPVGAATRRGRGPCSTRSWSEAGSTRAARRGEDCRPQLVEPLHGAALALREAVVDCPGGQVAAQHRALRRTIAGTLSPERQGEPQSGPAHTSRQINTLAGTDAARSVAGVDGWRPRCACSASRRRNARSAMLQSVSPALITYQPGSADIGASRFAGLRVDWLASRASGPCAGTVGISHCATAEAGVGAPSGLRVLRRQGALPPRYPALRLLRARRPPCSPHAGAWHRLAPRGAHGVLASELRSAFCRRRARVVCFASRPPPGAFFFGALGGGSALCPLPLGVHRPSWLQRLFGCSQPLSFLRSLASATRFCLFGLLGILPRAFASAACGSSAFALSSALWPRRPVWSLPPSERSPPF